MSRLNRASHLLSLMLQPELRTRTEKDLHIPSINLIEPDCIFNFLEINTLIKLVGYRFRYRVQIYAGIDFCLLMIFTLILYLDMFNYVDIYNVNP